MLELTGIAPVLRALGILYWALAAAAIAAALWLPKKSLHKAGAALLAAGLFAVLPAKNWIEYREREAYAQAAWAHFRKLCAEKAGEKIYKTFTGVKSVLVVKPLPPATEKDLFDQYWYGDPFSNATPSERRPFSAARRLVGHIAFLPPYEDRSVGYEYVEVQAIDSQPTRVLRVYPSNSPPFFWEIKEAKSVTSRLGISWEDISTPDDRSYWIAGSRLRVVDLDTQTTVAERVGFLIEYGFGSRSGGRRPWLQSRMSKGATCPAFTNGDFEDRWFVLKVASPFER